MWLFLIDGWRLGVQTDSFMQNLLLVNQSDAIATKTSSQIVLCAFNPSPKGLQGANSLTKHVWISLNASHRRCMSPAWGQCWRLAPQWYTLPSATNGFNPPKLGKVARQEGEITEDNIRRMCVWVCVSREERGCRGEEKLREMTESRSVYRGSSWGKDLVAACCKGRRCSREKVNKIIRKAGIGV